MSQPNERPSNQPSLQSASGASLQAHSDAASQTPFDVSQRTDFDILVCGPIRVDYLLLLDQAPRKRHTSHIVRELRRAGGFGWNCAAALATWGARVALVGNAIGTDSNGRAITRELASLPNLRLLSPIDEIETPYVVVSWAQSARFSMRLQRGAMNIEHTALPKVRYAVLGGERNKPFFNPEVAAHLGRDRVPYLVRGKAGKPAWAPEASGFTLSVGKKRVCRKILIAEREARYVRARIQESRDVLNDDAAEDVFVAGIAWARWQGWSFGRAIHFASAASMLKGRGSSEGWPRLEDVEAIME